MAFAGTSPYAPSFFSGFSFTKVRNAFARGLTRMQVARMNGVLAQMSTDQLHQIGITRSEIADYAEMLILRGASKS